MSTPDWLREGRLLWDPGGEPWRVLSIGATWIELGNPDRGRHELLREDLISWVEDGEWERE